MGSLLAPLFSPSTNPVLVYVAQLFIASQVLLEPFTCFNYPDYMCGRGRTPVPAPTTPAPTLDVKPFQIRFINTGEVTEFNAAFQAAKARWEEIVVGDLPETAPEVFIVDMFDSRLSNREPIREVVDDLTIGIEVRDLGPNTIVRADPAFRRGDGTTITGTILVDYRSFSQETEMSRVVLLQRAIGRVLGFGSRLWNALDCSQCKVPNATSEYLCSAAREAYQNLDLGRPNVGTGGVLQLNRDCRWWSNDSFNASDYTDLMVEAYDRRKIHLITNVTIAALTDIAAYQVNFDAADPIPPNPTTRRQRTRRRIRQG